MLFPSQEFLFVFLPAVLGVYYLFLRKTVEAKNIFLLLASLFFYAWGEPDSFFLLLAVILLNWLFGIAADRFRQNKRALRAVMAVTVLTDIGILGWYKYSIFVVSNINRFLHVDIPLPAVALPIGISFFTFQAVSYVADVARGKGSVQKNPLHVGLFISLFPQLIAGPIVRYETFAGQIRNRRESLQDFSAGVTRFCVGLGKKVLIANNMAQVADMVFNELLLGKQFHASVATAWLGAVSYTLQIFYDFSGYSDMAIGLGRMFGFHFEENFRYPYMAATVTDFWRRWHISLQTWFRDYLYIPLGGSRVSRGRLVLNLFIVWALTGLWHGAWWTFLAWGLLYFVLLAFEKLTGLGNKNYKWGHIYTMFFVVIGWVLFRSPNMGSAAAYLKAMFGIGASGLADSAFSAFLAQNWVYYFAAILGCFPLFERLDKKLSSCRAWNVAYAAGMLVILAVSVSFICNDAYNPFIYFNF